MGFFNQLLLLLWKNFTLRKRQKLRLVAEIVFPLALFMILVIVRTTKPDLKVKHPECHFDGKALPSAGVLPFLQTYICTFNNTCYETVTQDERQDSLGNFNQSVLTELITELEEILTNRVDVELISDLLEDINILADIWPKLLNGSTVGNITLGGDNIIDPSSLRNQIVNQDFNLTSDVVDWLLNATLNRRFLRDGVDELSLLTILGDFMPPNYASMTRDQVAQYVRAEVCNETRLKEIFWFPNKTVSDDVHSELCALSTDQFIELGNDFVNAFSLPEFLIALEEFIKANTGENGTLNNADEARIEHMILTGEKLLLDIQNSDSWQKAFSDIQSTFQQMREQGIGQNAASSASALTGMSELVCGRGNSFLSVSGSPAQRSRVQVNPNMNSAQSESSRKDATSDNGTATCIFPPISSTCLDLFNSFQATEGTRILWRQLKPFVLGMILYYPKNNATEQLINDAGQLFTDMKAIINLSYDWMNTSADLNDTLYNSRVVNFVRGLVDNPLCDVAEDMVRRRFSNMTGNYNGSVCEYLAAFLDDGPKTTSYDWRDALENLNELFGAIYTYGNCFNFDKFCGYTDRTQMTNDSLKMIDQDLFWAAIEFDNVDGDSIPEHVSYRIRMDVDKVDSTKRVMDKYFRYAPRRIPGIDTKYFTYGFVYIQDMIEHAIIKVHTGLGDLKASVGIFTQQFPYFCYTQDKFIYAISRMLPLFMILAWLLTTAMLCKSIVYEKERRLKEVMKIMGLSNGVHWVAWFINAFVMMFATILLLILLLKGGQVLEHSDPSVILFFMTVFAVATIVKCFLISVFFSRPNLAACCAGFIYFMLYLPYMLMIQWDDQLTLSIKLGVSLSSNVAFGYGCNFIALWEEQAVGIQWKNLLESPITDDEMNMMHCIMMMIIDTVIYGLLTWYIEAIFPGQYGIPKPFYFPFMKSYWCGDQQMVNDGNELGHGGLELNGHNSANMEAEPKDRKVGVALKKLTKLYSSGQKRAVDGLTINFFEDQITSFLGHNGAGKTTTMSILTGLFPPTEGTAYIHGEDIRFRMDHIRHSLGMCPQHNVLFDWLTVEEHLWFYARLKGAQSEKVKVEMKKMIKDVGLTNKRNEMSANLSGGMKRKLSVAIAFVGNSKTVILDEPTAGVDPYARRAIWQILLKLKKGRTIILSTHHMDEADVLGDRIAIISQGKLCCVGSSLFLKNRYGNGYYLTLVRSDDDLDEEELLKKELFEPQSRPMSAGSVRTIVDVQPSLNETEDEGYAEKSDSDPPTPPPENTSVLDFSVKKVTAFIKKYVRDARLVEDNMTEMCYQLPDEAARQGDFEKLFLNLERSHKDLGISSFGISDTSLEEVFLRVADETEIEEMSDESKRNKLEEISDGGRYPRSVSRLSFRRKKKLSLFGKGRTHRVDSKAELMAEDDTESVVSGPVSEYGENGFSHLQAARVTGWRLTLRQFMAIFLKRFHHVRRSKKGFLVEIVLPVIFILLAMSFALIAPPLTEEPPLELHPWHYVPKKGDQNLFMFYSNDAHESDVTKDFQTNLLSRTGVGNRCSKKGVNGYPCEPVGPQTWTPYIYDNTTEDCSCDNGWQSCPAGAGGPTPSQIHLPTTDILYNMTDRNISDWLVKTIREYSKKRYGGLTFGEIDNTAIVTNFNQSQDALERILTAANNGTDILLGNRTFWNDLAEVLPRLVTRDVAKVWYNNKGWAASVSYINVMNNLILRSNLPAGKDPADYGITAFNHPMDMTKEQLNDEALYKSFKDVVIAICVIFAMSFIPASFTMYLIEERTSNSKHLQFVSGINPTVYWFSNFFWDMINYIVPSILCIFIFLAFNKAAYVSATNGPCLVALLFLYGWAMIPMMYPFSRLFSVPSTALVILNSVNVFLGTTSTLATFIIEFLEEDDPGLKDINTILRQVFLLMPQYCLGRGLFDMAKNQLFADVFTRLGEENKLPNPFDWNQVGRNLFAMFMLGILFFIINMLIEYGFFIKFSVIKPSGAALDDEDEDVAKERRRVMSGGAEEDVLKIQELTKVYRARGKGGKLTSVDRICVGVPRGQCFGLLGVNGAGKTTTFKMLTGDETLTRGNAYVNGHSILNEMVKVRQNIGYCPQFDALDALLTGVEHLRFYARIRGIPEKEVKHVADWAIRRLGLVPHADKISTNYSGGNKRKLSTAISLIGNPPIIFLDEPTTGMDPGARRFLWDCINNIVKDGRSVILTSHSMEECEALCGRLAIMVNGRFRCMGSIQHLKNRFGDGYTVIVRVSGEFPDMDPVMQYFNSHFPNSVLKEKHHNMLQYQLGSDIQLSTLFGQIEAARARLNIEDYSVSQTTLDQVFINFAKQQTDLADDEVDELPEDLAYWGTGLKKGAMIQLEEQSLAGSTVGLLRSNSIHTIESTIPPLEPLDKEEFQTSGQTTQPFVPKSQFEADIAPIISIPVQQQDIGATGDSGIVDETEIITRKRPRPLAKFDQFPSIPDPEI